MADSAGGEGRNGGGSGEPKRPTTTQAQARYAHARGYLHAYTYAHAQAYVLLAMKGSGLLALLISTVVLLGGYVQSLRKIDFFCIFWLSVIQAAGIFTDWENSREYMFLFVAVTYAAAAATKGFLHALSNLTIVAVVFCALLIWVVGPFACAAISSWRMWKLSHGIYRDGTDSMANMTAALNIFYSLVLLQGIVCGVHIVLIFLVRRCVVSKLLALEQMTGLGSNGARTGIHEYLRDICKKCRKDPLSIRGMDLINYAVELLDSEDQFKYLLGAALLSAFVKQGKYVRLLLLPSRQKIQRLIDSLSLNSSLGYYTYYIITEGFAATILADLAGDIDLAKYPEFMPCISSLLLQEKITQTYWNTKQVPGIKMECEQHFEDESQKKLMMAEEECYWVLMRHQTKPMIIENKRSRQSREATASYELILQGLTILERLAWNNGNCRLICSAPGLLPRITAPVYSRTLIDHVITIKAWPGIVIRSLKVLYKLICAPGRTSSRLRRQIYDQALGNLKSILDLGDEAFQELQLAAMGILTELALDSSISLAVEAKEILITKQLQFFLANGDGEESAAFAGRALVSLSASSESNSALVMSTQKYIVGRLTEILGAKNNTTHRTIAAEILENLCHHCDVDRQHMKEILLPKVLNEVMPIKRDPQQRKNFADQNNPASGDEESQKYSASGNDAEIQKISSTAYQNNSFDQGREVQEAFLSLTLVMSHKLDSADIFDVAIRDTIGREAFVDNLKSIVNDNCKECKEEEEGGGGGGGGEGGEEGRGGGAGLLANLRIVKLCCQIAESMMLCKQYAELFRNKEFKSALIEASATMSGLESRMLFHGTDFRRKKTFRAPLSSYIRNIDQLEHKLELVP